MPGVAQKGYKYMRVLLVKPNDYAVEADIENSLKALQQAVGGHIEVFTPSSDPVVYVLNEEGKIMGLDENRALYDNRGNLMDIATGTFLVCGVEGDDFISLSPELMEKYKRQLYDPELFIEQNGKIKAIKIDPQKPIAAQLAEGAERAAEQDRSSRPAPGKNANKDR